MKRPISLAWIALHCGPLGDCATLKEMYDRPLPGSGEDKWVDLQTVVFHADGLDIGRTFKRITQ